MFWSEKFHKNDRFFKVAQKLQFKIDEHYDPVTPGSGFTKSQKSPFTAQNDVIETKISHLQRKIESLNGRRKSSEAEDQFEKKRVGENDGTLERCLICLGDFVKWDKMAVLSCGRYYHKVRMIRWFDQKPNCPH